MAAGGQNGGDVLEDRLRNLILSNSERHHHAQQTLDTAPSRAPRQQPASQHGPDQPPSPSSPGNQGNPPSAKSSRRRPNQAQRRQMSAQLSIPIDPRPQFSEPQRTYVGPPGRQDQHGRGGYHRSPHEPRSATLRPPSRGNAVPGPPLTGNPFPSRPRHQASLSYHGPMTASNLFGWSQHAMQHGDARLPYSMPVFAGMSPMPPMPLDAPPSMHLRQGSADLSSPGRQFNVKSDELRAQAELLEGLCNTVVNDAEIEIAEIAEKEAFRVAIEKVARAAIADYERTQNGFHDFPPESVLLKCFGSLASGFATKASDMDLGLLSPLSRIQPDAPGSPIPRLVEKAFLSIGLGARLLSQTRVPIIKVCEKPPPELRLALLEARAKWERGAAEDPQEDDDVQESPDAQAADDLQLETQTETLSLDQGLTREQQLQRFKQGASSSLSTYYASCKRLLRKLGGRDITHSNIAEFKLDDVKLLNEVALAFVGGLANIKLRDRLLRYRSLNRYDLTSRPNLRTLLGVFAQVEGESMALAWESRPFPEKDKSREGAAESIVHAWRALQDNPEYGRDPLGYQKQLQLAAEQLRRIPSVQVLLLSQAHNESAANYHARAERLLGDLGGLDSPARAALILPTLLEHYIQGIWNHSIREQVEQFRQSNNVNNLTVIGRRHKSLQLAHEYETCLDKGVYPGETAATVRRYVELLRAPIAGAPSGGGPSGLIPLASDSASLLSEIRRLGDPSRAPPNQPRDRYSSALEFPKSGVGVQCDINFSAHLAVQNTTLLRCYSHCDPRVRPLVLFVKHWAKVRCINSPYRGTLGSYGYSLMMLHYLVNVATPFVCPNLQQLARPPAPDLTPQQVEETVRCKGRDVRFWRDEAEIVRLARENALTQNRETVGQLLRGFFEYFAKGGHPMSMLPCRSFDWGRDVLSLRTPGGLLTKQAKGWTGAKTVVEVQSAAGPPAGGNTGGGMPTVVDQITPAAAPRPATELAQGDIPPPQQQQQAGQSQNATLAVKEVRYRYLFAIEDPFELDHNVARTVTHAGIVAIRNEFRRAWRIIKNAGRPRGASHSHTLGQAQGQGSTPGHTPGPGRGHHGDHQQPQQQQQQQQQRGGEEGEEDLLEDVGAAEEAREREQFDRLLEELHGVSLAGLNGA